MNISLYKNRLFLLTVFKQLEKSLQILNKYIDQYILCILLFSIQHYPSNSIQHTLALLRVTTKFFYQALWIGWKVSSENFFRLLKPFPKREESQHISRKHDVCGMSELNVYSLRSLRKLQSCENVNFLPNLVSMTVHYRHYYLRLKKISRKVHRRYCHYLYFLSPLNFPK